MKWAQLLAWRWMWPWVGSFGWLMWRMTARGQDDVPREGPILILPNHTSTFDPIWVAFFLWRPMHFMASAQLFRYKALGLLISLYGAFPKAKFVRDKGAMVTLNKLWDAGRPVLIFPEGRRTWDGRTHEVLPGIGRLINRLEARVVYARILTGHLNQPRWATYPRWVPIQVEYDGPHTYEGQTAEEITADVNRRIRIDHRRKAEGFTFGWRMAYGLSDYLWACPVCFQTDALRVHPDDGNAAICSHCAAHWRLDTSNRLHRQDADEEPLLVPDALDRVVAHFGDPPVVDRERFESEDVVIWCTGSVGKVERGAKPVTLAEGRLTLTSQRLQVLVDGEEGWGTPLADIRVISFELHNVLQIRTRDDQGLLQVTPGVESTLMWGHFISAWRDIRQRERREQREKA